MRHTPQKPNPMAPYGRKLPPGWTMSARGLWHHENGARVEDRGVSMQRYEATDADGVRVKRDTRAEAMAWAGGDET